MKGYLNLIASCAKQGLIYGLGHSREAVGHTAVKSHSDILCCVNRAVHIRSRVQDTSLTFKHNEGHFERALDWNKAAPIAGVRNVFVPWTHLRVRRDLQTAPQENIFKCIK